MTLNRTMTTVAQVLATLTLAGLLLAQNEDLGRTEFPTSGSPQAQKHFLCGVLLLHSFEYDDAAEAFREAQKVDPDFAMAYWGEAMTYNHPLWRQQDRQAALAALQRLAPTPEARLAKAPTPREKGYLQAVEILYGDGDKEARDRAYAQAMRELSEAFPDDLDAASFYALATLGTSHGGRDFSIYMRAAAVAEEVFSKNPQHPGAAHYLIHSYDDPVHAPLGLRAARVYARIAPAAAHALHMPSHIFVALGMWDDVVASNEASWAAADARVKRKGLTLEDRGYHALWWLTYGYLQQGRHTDARRLLAIMEEDARKSGSRRTRRHLVVMRAAYVVNTERWDSDVARIDIDTSGLGLRGIATDLFVAGLVAVKTGDRAGAANALSDMRARRTSAAAGGSNAYPLGIRAAEIMEKELEALIRLAEGEPDDAVRRLRQATRAEDDMSFQFGPPSVVKPSHELLGEVLLELDRAAEARVEFERALARAPKRALSLLGRARAASRSGDPTTAQRTYAELQKIWHRADADLPVLDEIRRGASLAKK